MLAIIFFCFVQAEAEIMGFIEQLKADDVLTESVIGKDDLCFRVISEHVVRPVDQRHLDERELMLAGVQRIFGLDPVGYSTLKYCFIMLFAPALDATWPADKRA